MPTTKSRKSSAKGGTKKSAARKGAAKKGASKRGGTKKGASKTRGPGGILATVGTIASGVGSLASTVGGIGRRDLTVGVPRSAGIRDIAREIERQFKLSGCPGCRSGIDRIIFQDRVAGGIR